MGPALGLLGLVIMIVGGLLVFTLADEPLDPGATRTMGGSAVNVAPQVLATSESYVEARVRATGDVAVRQWIRADAPLTSLRLALPEVPGVAELSATDVELLADGVTVAGPGAIIGVGAAATYTFEETTDIQLRYVLTGAVDRSDSAAGRALAIATTLDVSYSPQTERETRIVHAPEVLSLACSASPEASPVPCGQADGLDRWQVELIGPRVGDRVVAQVNLG